MNLLITSYVFPHLRLVIIDKQPYLYNYAGAAHKSQEWVRKIGEEEYNHTAGGLSGVCPPHFFSFLQSKVVK